MTDNPVLDAERHFDALEDAAEVAEAQLIEATENLETDFISFALQNVKVPATFSEPYTDCSLGMDKKRQCYSTVAEIMAESLDYAGGPTFDELMQLLSDAARGEEIRPQALNLVKRMAAKYAQVNAA